MFGGKHTLYTHSLPRYKTSNKTTTHERRAQHERKARPGPCASSPPCPTAHPASRPAPPKDRLGRSRSPCGCDVAGRVVSIGWCAFAQTTVRVFISFSVGLDCNAAFQFSPYQKAKRYLARRYDLHVRPRPPHLLHAPARASTFLSGRAAPQRRPERLRVTGAALR